MKPFLTGTELQIRVLQSNTKSTEELKKEAAKAIDKIDSQMSKEDRKIGWSVTGNPEGTVPVYIYGKRLLEENNIYDMDIRNRLTKHLDSLKELCDKHRVVAEMGRYLNPLELVLAIAVAMVWDEDMKAIAKDDVDRSAIGHFISHAAVSRVQQVQDVIVKECEKRGLDQTVGGMYR